MSTNTTIKFGLSCDIAIPYGELQPVIEWCQNNVVHNWQYKVLNQAGSSPGFYQFIFEDAKDYTNFMLWKK